MLLVDSDWATFEADDDVLAANAVQVHDAVILELGEDVLGAKLGGDEVVGFLEGEVVDGLRLTVVDGLVVGQVGLAEKFAALDCVE